MSGNNCVLATPKYIRNRLCCFTQYNLLAVMHKIAIKIPMTVYRIKRIYDPAEEEDGFRVLVDGLWPRGFTKEKAKIDLWIKEIAPSTELRRWFHHQDRKWSAFEKRYLDELNNNEPFGKIYLNLNKHKVVTLLYAAQNKEHNHARVLKAYFESRK